jgi:hypothetical protein
MYVLRFERCASSHDRSQGYGVLQDAAPGSCRREHRSLYHRWYVPVCRFSAFNLTSLSRVQASSKRCRRYPVRRLLLYTLQHGGPLARSLGHPAHQLSHCKLVPTMLLRVFISDEYTALLWCSCGAGIGALSVLCHSIPAEYHFGIAAWYPDAN